MTRDELLKTLALCHRHVLAWPAEEPGRAQIAGDLAALMFRVATGRPEPSTDARGYERREAA